jgi:NodT family efflux transporter outer membrane factor (OMF) lipoprotein
MTRRPTRCVAFAAGLIACGICSGCTVGPDFQKPAAPETQRYTADPLAQTSGVAGFRAGKVQQFVAGQDIPGDWWTLFHSQILNDLIDRSLKNSPDLKAGQAALLAARENVLAQNGAYYPSVAAGFSASRQRTSAVLSATPDTGALTFDLFVPQVSVSYAPDVFGLNRRSVEALNAQAEQTHFALIATQLSLTANVVAAAIQEASLRAQVEATRRLVAINTEIVQILRNQLEKGYVGRLDLAVQESQLAQATASLPPLLKQLSQQHDLLAALSGAFPDTAFPEAFDLSGLQLPDELPVSLPSRLVEQRPDIRQAEENMHAASAQIGVAVANRLPNITLSADAGSSALAIGQVFSSGAGMWSLGAGIAQPIFDGGQLLHRERAARAAYEQAAQQYRSTVLTAFQNVADTLNALKHDADALKAATAAETAADTTLDLARQQEKAGYTNGLALLNAEQSYQQAQTNLIQAEANRFTDTAALFQALGGGWWNRTDSQSERAEK